MKRAAIAITALVGWAAVAHADSYDADAYTGSATRWHTEWHAEPQGPGATWKLAGIRCPPEDKGGRILQDPVPPITDPEVLLEAAAEGDFGRVVEALLEAGADVNVTAEAAGVGGWTPLMFAAATGDTEIAEALLAANARPGARNARGLTAHAIAEQKGHDEVAQLLPRPGGGRAGARGAAAAGRARI